MLFQEGPQISVDLEFVRVWTERSSGLELSDFAASNFEILLRLISNRYENESLLGIHLVSTLLRHLLSKISSQFGLEREDAQLA